MFGESGSECWLLLAVCYKSRLHGTDCLLSIEQDGNVMAVGVSQDGLKVLLASDQVVNTQIHGQLDKRTEIDR